MVNRSLIVCMIICNASVAEWNWDEVWCNWMIIMAMSGMPKAMSQTGYIWLNDYNYIVVCKCNWVSWIYFMWNKFRWGSYSIYISRFRYFDPHYQKYGPNFPLKKVGCQTKRSGQMFSYIGRLISFLNEVNSCRFSELFVLHIVLWGEVLQGICFYFRVCNRMIGAV